MTFQAAPSPLMTVILPVYNGASYLSKAIQSVLDQSLEDIEILIRDDGSKDESLSIIESFQDSRIRLIENKTNLGLFGNLNALISESKSPLIHIFCQDDILERDCLKIEKIFFDSHPEIGMSFCKSKALDASGNVNNTPLVIDLPSVMEPELSLQHFFYHGCIPGNLSTVCMRRSALDQVGLFDSSLKVSGDYELWTRIGSQYAMGVIHQQLVFLRHHEERLSNRPESVIRFIRENRKIRTSLIGLLPPSTRNQARSFEKRRHGVSELHQGLRLLLRGNWDSAKEVFSIFGKKGFVESLFFWLITGNNRLYRPQARWILPKNYQVG